MSKKKNINVSKQNPSASDASKTPPAGTQTPPASPASGANQAPPAPEEVKNPPAGSENIKPVTEAITAKKVVILGLGKNDSEELVALSLRAWQKNYGAQVLLIGGKYSDLPAIDHLPDEDENKDFANRIAAIVADERVPEIFVYSPVNAFPVNKITESNIDTLKALTRKLANQRVVCMKDFSELAVNEQVKKAGGTDVFNYETGLPVKFDKEKLVVLFEQFNPQKYPTKLTSLYLNVNFAGFKPYPVNFIAGIFATRVLRREPNLSIVQQGLEDSDFFVLNNEGYIATASLIEEHLA